MKKETEIVGELKRHRNASLVDALDKVVEKGAYVSGHALINVADIELIYIGLHLVVSSVSNLPGNENRTKDAHSIKDRQYIQALQAQLKIIEESLPKIMQANNPAETEKGLAKLVLTLVELIRQLLEREAVRRVEKGDLSETQMHKLSLTFKVLEKKIEQLKAVFGIKEDLNIDLGPLGKVL